MLPRTDGQTAYISNDYTHNILSNLLASQNPYIFDRDPNLYHRRYFIRQRHHQHDHHDLYHHQQEAHGLILIYTIVVILSEMIFVSTT